MKKGFCDLFSGIMSIYRVSKINSLDVINLIQKYSNSWAALIGLIINSRFLEFSSKLVKMLL